MAVDSALVLQALVTKTATFNGAGLDLGSGTPRRGLKVRVIYKNASNASGSNTVAFTVDHSDDNSTFYQLASDVENNVALSATVQSGEVFIPIETSKRYIRLTATVSGGGSTPTIDYFGDVMMSRP